MVDRMLLQGFPFLLESVVSFTNSCIEANVMKIVEA